MVGIIFFGWLKALLFLTAPYIINVNTCSGNIVEMEMVASANDAAGLLSAEGSDLPGQAGVTMTFRYAGDCVYQMGKSAVSHSGDTVDCSLRTALLINYYC